MSTKKPKVDHKAEHKKAIISAIHSSKNMDSLASVFFSAFGAQFAVESQIEKGRTLKEAFLNTQDEIEKYKAWVDLHEFEKELASFSDGRVQTIEQEIGLKKELNDYFTKNFSLVDDFHNQKLQQLKQKGEEYSAQYLNGLDLIRFIDKEIKDLEKDTESAFSNGSEEYAYKAVELVNIKAKKKELIHQVFMPLYQSLFERSLVTNEEAQEWAHSIQISKKALNNLDIAHYEEFQFREDLAEYYRLTNGAVGAVRFDKTESVKDRASANLSSLIIKIDKDFDKRTLYHELSHLLENDVSLRMANRAFIKKRANGNKLVQLKEMLPKSNYRPDEMVFLDHFYSLYVGKHYDDNATEVLSMGVDKFHSIDSMQWFFDKDPEHFNLTLGTLLSLDGSTKQNEKILNQRLIKDNQFQLDLKKHIDKLKWVKGHSSHLSDSQWDDIVNDPRYLKYRKIYLELTLGSTTFATEENVVNKKGKKIGLRYLAKPKDTENNEYIYMSKDRFTIEMFIYLTEILNQGIHPSTQDAAYLVQRRQAPEWYEIGMELPII